jgi:hypothetical protein
MTTPEEVRLAAAEYTELARDDLRKRGLDPSAYPRLLEALETGAQQLAAARVRGRSPEPYTSYLSEVERRLAAARPVDDARIEPPKRTLAVGGHGWPDEDDAA